MITGNEPINAIVSLNATDCPGLTIRQYYVGLAIQGICVANLKEIWGGVYTPAPEYISQFAVQFADALISELNKNK